MKIINLKGFMKSEFKEDVDYSKVFDCFKLSMGRMISGSKSDYRERYPDNLVIFNANVITKNGGKVWYGDLSFPPDTEIMQSICNKLRTNLYVIREMDARFENENAGITYWKEKSIKVFKPII
jgi:hypothetical protein